MWRKISYFIGGLAAIVGGGLALLGYFVLPACDSDRATDTVRSIFAGQNVPLTTLDDIKTLSDASDRIDCEAHIDTPDETGTIKYSVTWDGWSAQIRIDEVNATPLTPPEPEAPAAPEPPAALEPAPAPEPPAMAPVTPEQPAMAPEPTAPAPEAPAPAPEAPAAPTTPPG